MDRTSTQLCGGYEVAPRPCRQTGCRYHLDHDRGRGTARTSDETCSLDLAERGGMTLEEVGDVLGITRERIRQIEAKALTKLGRHGAVLQGDKRAPEPVARPERKVHETPRARPSNLTAEILRLRAEGLSQRAIGAHVGVSHASVCKILKDHRVGDGAEVVALPVDTSTTEHLEEEAS